MIRWLRASSCHALTCVSAFSMYNHHVAILQCFQILCESLESSPILSVSVNPKTSSLNFLFCSTASLGSVHSIIRASDIIGRFLQGFSNSSIKVLPPAGQPPQAFYAEATAFIFLYPGFLTQSPVTAPINCPEVMHNT